MKLKTKKELHKLLLARDQEVYELTIAKQNLEIKLEAFTGESEFSNKVISEIGSIVFGPQWMQTHSRGQIKYAVEQLKMQSNLNGGMFEGMREAHRVVLEKLSTVLSKQGFKDGV